MTFGSKIMSLNFFVLALFFLDIFFKYYFKLKDKFFINQYIAFGIKLDKSWVYLFSFIIIVFIFYGLNFFYRKRKILYILALSLILFGALSNLFDRLKFGYVIDYINFPANSVFNIADVMIVLGSILLIHQFFIFKKEENVK